MHKLRVVFAVVIPALALSTLLSASGSAATLKTLYAFCAQGGCPDGEAPIPGLARDGAGNLYGTAELGGTYNAGVVFEIKKKSGAWTFALLHSFCPSCGDGTYPEAGLVVDVNGRLYGTTDQGGASGCGTLFQLSPNARHSKWTETLLHSFDCGGGGEFSSNGLSYQGAATGQLYDGVSPLFGMTDQGGASNSGTVFEIAPNGGSWSLTTLYSFCPQGQNNCTDGMNPAFSTLTLDASGSLFGETEFGGATGGGGTVFTLSQGRDFSWSEKVLYSFCIDFPACSDGQSPLGAVLLDPKGAVIGTAAAGGNANDGVLFKLKSGNGAWHESVLHSFCSQPNCADGGVPWAGVTADAAGGFIGTTGIGGPNGQGGTIFKLKGSTYSVLYGFCALGGCADGAAPEDRLLMNASGNLFGVTLGGGNGIAGTVFKLRR